MHDQVRELVLVEVAVTSQKRAELIELAGLCDAKIVSVQPKSLTIQLVGEKEQISNFMDLLKGFKVSDLARTGVIAVSRGESTNDQKK